MTPVCEDCNGTGVDGDNNETCTRCWGEPEKYLKPANTTTPGHPPTIVYSEKWFDGSLPTDKGTSELFDVVTDDAPVNPVLITSAEQMKSLFGVGTMLGDFDPFKKMQPEPVKLTPVEPMTLGEVAYTAFYHHTFGSQHIPTPPRWSDLKGDEGAAIRVAWECVASSVRMEHTRRRVIELKQLIEKHEVKL